MLDFERHVFDGCFPIVSLLNVLPNGTKRGRRRALLHVVERQRLRYLEQISIQFYRRASLANNLLAHETLEHEQVKEIVGELLYLRSDPC